MGKLDLKVSKPGKMAGVFVMIYFQRPSRYFNKGKSVIKLEIINRTPKNVLLPNLSNQLILILKFS